MITMTLMDQPTELNLTIIQGTTFRQRLTIRDGGVPVPLIDRSFSGRIVAKPNGITISDLQFVMADQTTNPGEFDILVPALKTAKMPLNESPKGFLIPTIFFHAIKVTYSARPNDPESFAFGNVYCYPQAGG